MPQALQEGKRQRDGASASVATLPGRKVPAPVEAVKLSGPQRRDLVRKIVPVAGGAPPHRRGVRFGGIPLARRGFGWRSLPKTGKCLPSFATRGAG